MFLRGIFFGKIFLGEIFLGGIFLIGIFLYGSNKLIFETLPLTGKVDGGRGVGWWWQLVEQAGAVSPQS